MNPVGTEQLFQAPQPAADETDRAFCDMAQAIRDGRDQEARKLFGKVVAETIIALQRDGWRLWRP